jgi:hypothetical protein
MVFIDIVLSFPSERNKSLGICYERLLFKGAFKSQKERNNVNELMVFINIVFLLVELAFH